MSSVKHALVGKFFHTYKNDKIHCQGKVLAEVTEGVFLVQLFDWTMGAETDQFLVTINGAAGWKFYSTHEDWIGGYKRYDDMRSALGRTPATQQTIKHNRKRGNANGGKQ